MEIAILDFGGQYVFNIRRVLSEKGFNADIVPYNISAKQLDNTKGIILSGGPYSVYDITSPLCDVGIFKLGVPVLGLCYGYQVIAHFFRGNVKRGKVGEYGFSEVNIDTSNPLFQGLNEKEICWMSHGDIVSTLPQGFQNIASTKESKIAAIQGKNNIYGLQFHPEVSHTPKGHRILENFARLCGCSQGSWDVKNFIENAIQEIIKEAGYGTVIIAVSGGVDSTTAAVLASKAIGDKLRCIHLNHGLMRKNESREVVNMLKNLGLNLIYVNAEEHFLKTLKGITNSDDKRQIIGELFIREFEQLASKIKATSLIQGTIAPDIIESTRGEANSKQDSEHGGLIKIHHNVAGLPKGMKLKLIEPLSPLFKYQVRILAKKIGIPPELADRQPFPGPGLSCRISGEITMKKIKMLREINEIVEKELAIYNPSQYFAILLTGKVKAKSSEAAAIASKYLMHNVDVDAYTLTDEAIGVKGDERVIGNPLCISTSEDSLFFDNIPWVNLLKMQNKITGSIQEICRVFIKIGGNIEKKQKGYGIAMRAVETSDFMTAIPSKINFDLSSKVGKQIVKQFGDIAFVCYDISTKPAATIELI